MIIGADVGGTFTDIVAVDDGEVRSIKVPTSSPQSVGVAGGATALSGGDVIKALVHGTTVATNALLERRGANTVLVTDEGFEDVIEIARQDRPSLYDPEADRSEPLVARSSRIGVGSSREVGSLPGADAVAVALINGHRDGEAEAAIAAVVSERLPGAAVSLSSVVAPEFREFERVSTTVLNAYLTPVTATYLRHLESELVESGLAASVSVMRSSGGLMSLEAAADLPAAVLLSGPAGGVVASQRLAERLGFTDVVSFDMGGTSTDVCLIEDGVVDVSFERDIDGYTCRLPAVGVHTVGAGGGSIAWIDAGGSLRVGPQSAGAEPGPACYRQGGTAPTVTDANVVLGRIGSEAALGGSLEIDADLARGAVLRIADPLGLSLQDAALGILQISEATMAGAVRTVSIDAGTNPAEAHLVAFGGAGGLHASAVAKSLGMAGVVVPPLAGVFSAVGLLLAPPRTDAVAAIHIVGEDLSEAEAVAARLRRSSSDAVVDTGSVVDGLDLHLDVRYVGQAHEVSVPWGDEADHPEVVGRFEELHGRRYGFVRHGDPVEVMAVRCSAVGVAPLASMVEQVPSGSTDGPRTREVVSGDGSTLEAAIVDRTSLVAGDEMRGPLVVEEDLSTTWVDAGEVVSVASDGSLVITW